MKRKEIIMIILKRSFCSLAAILMMAAFTSAADVPVPNGDFELLTETGKPVGWIYTGVADDFGSAVYPADSNNLVGFLADGQLIYQDIPDYQLQLDHRVTVSFDVTKQPQSGPSTILIQLLYVKEEGGLDYAGDIEECAVELEVFGGGLQRNSVSINIDDAKMDGRTFRIRFYATVQNEGKKIYLDNVTVEDTRPLVGDINYDGVVNWDDLDILLANWGISNLIPKILRPVVGPVPEELLPARQ
jgi:hypothetical protein